MPRLEDWMHIECYRKLSPQESKNENVFEIENLLYIEGYTRDENQNRFYYYRIMFKKLWCTGTCTVLFYLLSYIFTDIARNFD